MIQKYHENDQKAFVGQMSRSSENLLYPAVGVGVCVIQEDYLLPKKTKKYSVIGDEKLKLRLLGHLHSIDNRAQAKPTSWLHRELQTAA